MKKAANRQHGFTLIELMITIAIAVILMTVGIPSFSETIKNNRLTTEINELLTALNVGRSEAIKRGVSTTVCTGSVGASCGGNWEDGWVVFVDSNGDGTIDAGEEIRVHDSLTPGTTIAFPRTSIVYSGQGFAVGFTGTFVLCDSRGVSKAKGLVVSNTGRVRTASSSELTTAGC